MIVQTWLTITPNSPASRNLSRATELEPDQGDCEGVTQRGRFGRNTHTPAVGRSEEASKEALEPLCEVGEGGQQGPALPGGRQLSTEDFSLWDLGQVSSYLWPPCSYPCNE